MQPQTNESTMNTGSKNRIFVCYTTRDSYVTENLLKGVERMLTSYGLVFIDCLHNKSVNKQQEVIKQLVLSDVFIILDSPMLKTSPWVVVELYLASCMLKPIIVIPIQWNPPQKGKIQLTMVFTGKQAVRFSNDLHRLFNLPGANDFGR